MKVKELKRLLANYDDELPTSVTYIDIEVVDGMQLDVDEFEQVEILVIY